MPKRLVLCCDGTWNVPDQVRGGRPCPSNVTKLALGVSAADEDGVLQRVHYHPGVGTNRWERLQGGAFGVGLSRDVRDVYRFIVQNYEPGDQLFFFGFSRGAYTARSTAGLVRNAGILRPENVDRIDDAYRLYRRRREHPRGTESQLFRRSLSYETRIRFIGVWDTVGALGIPMTGLRSVNAVNRRWQFHDTDLSTTVDAAFQALAIDEHRAPFRPAVWSRQPDAGDQRLEQVWFAGTHCDVGGGYPDAALADVALIWMVERAQEYGLAFGDGYRPVPPGGKAVVPGTDLVVGPDPLGPLHESRTGAYRLQPPFIRPIGGTDRGNERVASSAVRRCEQDPAYTPPGLLAHLRGRPEVAHV